VTVQDTAGYYMFVDDRYGWIRNQRGGDGLRPHPDENPIHYPHCGATSDRFEGWYDEDEQEDPF